jgi:hypothetical protein
MKEYDSVAQSDGEASLPTDESVNYGIAPFNLVPPSPIARRSKTERLSCCQGQVSAPHGPREHQGPRTEVLTGRLAGLFSWPLVESHTASFSRDFICKASEGLCLRPRNSLRTPSRRFDATLITDAKWWRTI